MLLVHIEITNFLSIKDTLPIDLDKNVTILLGSNDHGKSNVLRAIERLNYKDLITEDESNWDASGPPSISYTLSLTPAERTEWKTLVTDLIHETMEAPTTPMSPADAAKQPEPPKPTNQPRVFPAGWRPHSIAADISTEALGPHGDEFYLDPDATTVMLSRKGVSKGLEFGGVLVTDLPAKLEAFFDKNRPRVELFRALTGSLQDSATAATINTDEYEFLQGVFFYAGLNPSQMSQLFTQDDKTIRELDNASKQLDQHLRNLWGQGTELHFELRHKGSEILFLADDPSIKSRKARMSKRSAGVTQFFRVSMVLHARRKKHPANSYIYLFDEPGVLLHPQGQRDLLQVFEELPKDLDERVQQSWADFKALSEKPEKKPRSEKAEKEEKDERRTAGRWFKDCSQEILGDEASKVVLARIYSELCREMKNPIISREKVKESKPICHEIVTSLSLPSVRAARMIEVSR
jgi:hypothetical protein